MKTNHHHKIILTTAPKDSPVWVQVAASGEFNGYAGGTQSFTFDQRTFDQIVANFHRHPAYRSGQSDVVPWDFHHASELEATHGTIPSAGAPAQGWIRELEVRHGPQGAELWALTRWLEPARSYVKEGRYQWASVSVVFDAVDPRSGKHVGPTLTSVAITNQPFIEGMQKLAATRRQSKGAPFMKRTLTISPEVAQVVNNYHLFTHLPPAAAVTACAQEHVPGAKEMNHRVLHREIVMPARLELQRRGMIPGPTIKARVIA